MAAFINALGEEGTLKECRGWVIKMREDNNNAFSNKQPEYMSKEECLTEITKLWEYECKWINPKGLK